MEPRICIRSEFIAIKRYRLGMGLNTRKAAQRLKLSKKAAVDLRFARTFDEFEDAWLTFLLHAKGVYVQLKAACKGNAKAMQWLGAKNAERRNDALMQYVFQSRDFAEHEPGAGARLEPGSLAIGVSSPGMSTSVRLDGSFETGLKVTSMDGKPIKIVNTPTHIKLLPVTARGGIVHQPPAMHLGRLINEPTPPVVADLCNDYLEGVLKEAEALSC